MFDFPAQLSHDVFAQMIRRAREGQQPQIGRPIEGILSNEIVYLFPIKRVACATYLRSSEWFYRRTKFPAVQLVWADAAGRFPWESDFDEEFATRQPDLSERGWLREIGDSQNSSFPLG